MTTLRRSSLVVPGLRGRAVPATEPSFQPDKPQRYLMLFALVDPDRLTRDAGDVLHDIERAICDDDSEDHACPLMTMSSRGFTEKQFDLVLLQYAMELRAAGWVVVRPEKRL